MKVFANETGVASLLGTSFFDADTTNLKIVLFSYVHYVNLQCIVKSRLNKCFGEIAIWLTRLKATELVCHTVKLSTIDLLSDFLAFGVIRASEGIASQFFFVMQ